MTISLELTPQLETQLRQYLALHDAVTVRRLLAEAATPIVERLLHETVGDLSDADFELLADAVAEEVVTYGPTPTPLLSKEAVSREGIYAEHP